MVELINPPDFGSSLLGTQEVEALMRVITRRELFRYHSDQTDSESDLFEKELGAWLNGGQVCAVASGTAGLRAALVAIGVKRGETVGVSALTFVATASAVLSLGAIPEPLDLDASLGMDTEDLRAKIDRLRAVITVYCPGHSSNVAEVKSLAHQAGIPVIEDACQALGVSPAEQRAGLIGDAGVFSFQQSKQLCAGEGGAVVTTNLELIARVRRFTDHGACRRPDGSPTWEPLEAGFGENLRMSELQAAVLRVQLKRLDEMLSKQRQIRNAARVLFEAAGAPIVNSADPSGDSGAYLALLLNSEETSRKCQLLAREHGLLLRHFWRTPFFSLPPFCRAAMSWPDSTPRALSWSSRLLGLPIPPIYSSQKQEQLLAAIAMFCRRGEDLWA